MLNFFRTTIKSLLIKNILTRTEAKLYNTVSRSNPYINPKVRQHLPMSDNINKQHHDLLAVILGLS